MARFSKPSGKAEKTTFSFSLCGGAITLKRLEKICEDLMRFGGAFTSDRNVTVLRLKPDSAKVASLPAATPPPAFHVSGIRETWKCKSVSISLSLSEPSPFGNSRVEDLSQKRVRKNAGYEYNLSARERSVKFVVKSNPKPDDFLSFA